MTTLVYVIAYVGIVFFLIAVAARFVQGIRAEQGHVPVVVDAVERMILEDPVDGGFQEVEPARP